MQRLGMMTGLLIPEKIWIKKFGSNHSIAKFIGGGAVELYHNNSNKLQTTATGINVTGVSVDDGAVHDGDVTFTGQNYNAFWDKSVNALQFADNAKATFGAHAGPGDLQIYHNGTASFIDNNTGFAVIRSDQFQVSTLNGTHVYINVPTNEQGVDLYFDNAKKLDTEAYGIEVTGTVGTDTLIVTGVSTVASLIFSAGTNTNGVAYFDANGQVQSTVAPASGISTSNSILTTNASGVPIWTDTIDCGTF